MLFLTKAAQVISENEDKIPFTEVLGKSLLGWLGIFIVTIIIILVVVIMNKVTSSKN